MIHMRIWNQFWAARLSNKYFTRASPLFIIYFIIWVNHFVWIIICNDNLVIITHTAFNWLELQCRCVNTNIDPKSVAPQTVVDCSESSHFTNFSVSILVFIKRFKAIWMWYFVYFNLKPSPVRLSCKTFSLDLSKPTVGSCVRTRIDVRNESIFNHEHRKCQHIFHSQQIFHFYTLSINGSHGRLWQYRYKV